MHQKKTFFYTINFESFIYPVKKLYVSNKIRGKTINNVDFLHTRVYYTKNKIKLINQHS